MRCGAPLGNFSFVRAKSRSGERGWIVETKSRWIMARTIKIAKQEECERSLYRWHDSVSTSINRRLVIWMIVDRGPRCFLAIATAMWYYLMLLRDCNDHLTFRGNGFVNSICVYLAYSWKYEVWWGRQSNWNSAVLDVWVCLEKRENEINMKISLGEELCEPFCLRFESRYKNITYVIM